MMQVNNLNQTNPVNMQAIAQNAQTPKDPMAFQNMLSEILQQNQSPAEIQKALSQLPLDFARNMSPKEVQAMASKLIGDDLLALRKRNRKTSLDLVDETQNVPYMGDLKKTGGVNKEILVGQLFPDDSEVALPFQEEDDNVLTPQNIYQEGFRDKSINLTPFQFFLDKSLDYFGRLSLMESKTDQLMVDYVEGRRSIEELTIEKAKVSVGISFAVTMTSQVQQSFSQLLNMQI